MAGGEFSTGRNPSSAFTAEVLLGKTYFHVARQTAFPVAVNDGSPTGLCLSASSSPRRVCLSIPTSLCQCTTYFFPFTAISLSLPPITCSASFTQTFLSAQSHTVCTHHCILHTVFIHPCILHTHIYIHKQIYMCMCFRFQELCYR